MASRLKQLGCTNVMILERTFRYGGKTHTVHEYGNPNDIGTCWMHPGDPLRSVEPSPPPLRHRPTPSRLPARSLPRLVPPPVDSTGYGPVIELIRKYEAGPIARPFGGVDARAAVDAEGKRDGSNRIHNPNP